MTTTRGDGIDETADAFEAPPTEWNLMAEWLRRTEEWFTYGDWRTNGGEQEFVLA